MYKELRETVKELTSEGQLFALTDVEVRGQTLPAWAIAPPTLRDLWLAAAAHGDADYLVYQDERWTYAQAHEHVASIANYLAANGIGKDDKVAIAMRNYPEWLLSFWAIVCIGAVPVGVNAWWVAEELEYGLKDSNTKLLICDRERLQRFESIKASLPELPVLTVRVDEVPIWATPWSVALASEPVLPDANIDPDDDVCIFYTSGTTGHPKGARLTHRGCANNVVTQTFATFALKTAQAKFQGTELPTMTREGLPQTSTIAATPLFHVTANGMALTLTAGGGKIVHTYKWDAGEALRLIEKEKITNFSGVPIMTREMFDHPDFAATDTSSVDAFGGGGAPVQADLIEKVGASGRTAVMAQGYGMTETSTMASAAYGIYQLDKPTSAGMVIPVFDAKCIDEQGNDLPAGETGELCLKGVQIFKGYLNRPDATADTIVDGWLHTGDIGYVDEDNFIYLVDRAKDMVLRGGENVYSSEVEMIVYRYDDVAECAVFAVPDDRLGEEVGVAVYAPQNSSLDADALRSFCKEHLAAFKVPRYIWVVKDPLPRNASGKFVKKELQKNLSIETAL
ncbi:MAG: class I adenylate-forming enzyme family protein [Pseudomonadales bacterium]